MNSYTPRVRHDEELPSPEALASRGQYWRAPVQERSEPPLTPAYRADACEHCETEFLMGAKYCHVCGASRMPATQPMRNFARAAATWLDFENLTTRLGLSPVALVLFVMGVACLLATVLTGVIYSPSTVLDWQAVQVWRIQWLLGAVAMFLGGILLNKK